MHWSMLLTMTPWLPDWSMQMICTLTVVSASASALAVPGLGDPAHSSALARDGEGRSGATESWKSVKGPRDPGWDCAALAAVLTFPASTGTADALGMGTCDASRA